MTENIDPEAAAERLDAIVQALRSGKPRPGKDPAAFAVAAAFKAEGEPGAIAESVRATRNVLREALKKVHAPGEAQEWVYAAVLHAADRAPEPYLALRERLRADRPKGGDGKLHARGVLAALVLAASAEPGGEAALIRRFFRLKAALRAPWWRRDLSKEDPILAAHAAQGDEPETVRTVRERAEAAFDGWRAGKDVKREAAHLAALLGADPQAAAARFDPLREAVKANKRLRHHLSKAAIGRLAVTGATTENIERIAQTAQALKDRKIAPMGGGVVSIATLIAGPGEDRLPAGAVAGFAAVQAAQTAMLTVVIASTTAATTTAGH